MTVSQNEITPVPVPFAKRTFDVMGTIALFIIGSPLIIFITIIFLIEYAAAPSSRGPLIYGETRYSAGVPFTIYKFRIFKKTAIEQARNGNGVVHTKQLEQNHDALTYLGKILRTVYLDELPQLFNIIKGDMTLVGPRPTNMDNMKNQVLQKKYAKLLLRAGLTGYFQSHKGIVLGKTQDEMDMEYVSFVKNNPGWKIVLYDLKILLISIKTILRAEGI